MQDKNELSVVDDQRGSPTYAKGLAAVIWQIIEADLFIPGIYHWTDRGDITWHEFAKAIQVDAIECGLLNSGIAISAITTEEYPTLAARPAYSVLDTSKLVRLIETQTAPWRDNLRVMLNRLNELQ